MLSIPIPCVSALLQALCAVLLIRRRGDLRTVAFIAMSACMAFLIGLRWSFQHPYGWFAVALVSSIQAPAAWLCFYRPGRLDDTVTWVDKVNQLLPLGAASLTLVLLVAGGRYWDWVEVLLVALYLGYGMALLVLGLGRHAQFGALRFSQEPEVRQAAVWAGCALIFNGVVEGVVGLDFRMHQGRHAPVLVGFAHVVLLPALLYGIWCAGRTFGAAPGQPALVRPPVPDAGGNAVQASAIACAGSAGRASNSDAAMLARLTDLVQAQELFRDPDLSLIKLARRMGVPARELSAVVNRQCGKNIAQWVNAFRIAAACEQLVGSDVPVTTVMLECGFFTKSNFNREFLRHTGLSPSAYRRQARDPAGAWPEQPVQTH